MFAIMNADKKVCLGSDNLYLIALEKEALEAFLEKGFSIEPVDSDEFAMLAKYNLLMGRIRALKMKVARAKNRIDKHS